MIVCYHFYSVLYFLNRRRADRYTRSTHNILLHSCNVLHCRRALQRQKRAHPSDVRMDPPMELHGTEHIAIIVIVGLDKIDFASEDEVFNGIVA